MKGYPLEIYLNGCFHGLNYLKVKKDQMNKENKNHKSQQNHKPIKKKNKV